MQTEMSGEDASLDAATQAILGKMQGGNDADLIDTRENRERDITERDTSTDLEESEREQREASADGEKPAEVESKDAKEGEAEDDAQFIELPAAEDGGEPERVPLTEAVEAVKQLRQMNGEIATAVIRAEEEAFTKHDQVTQQLVTTFEAVAKQATTALQMMHAYAPQPPDQIMLDRNSGYFDPEGYHNAKIHYDAFVAHYQKVQGTLAQANEGLKATNGQQDTELVRRETERAARFIPEFKDEKARDARKAEILDVLSKRYGVTQEDLAEVVDHKAWRMMNDLFKSVTTERKAPEVKKHLIETKAKIVNGRVSPARDPQNGRFMNEDRKALRETGSEDAFARMLVRSGALKGL